MSVSPRFYLFKRRNGFYYILIDHDGHRRWRSTGAKLKSEALQALREFQEHHELQAESPKTLLISQFTREYLEYLQIVHTTKGRDSAATALREFLRIVGTCKYYTALSHRQSTAFLEIRSDPASMLRFELVRVEGGKDT